MLKGDDTIVVEGEDPRRVIATVRRLGLGGRRNVSVARGIKAVLGVGAQRYAVIDIGTNSVKLHVAERSADGEWHTLADRAVADIDLDHTIDVHGGMSLRMVYVHLVQEYARHNGHADLLREAIDGTTGR